MMRRVFDWATGCAIAVRAAHDSGRVRQQAGQALVELLVAMGIAALMLPALATAMVASREGRAQQDKRLQASALLREANEAIRIVRQNGWAGFATNGTYYPAISGNSWALTAGTQTIGNYTRSITIADTLRDSGGAIAGSGTVDPSTRMVTATVPWTTPVADAVTSTSYLTRYNNNNTWTQTSEAEFNAGTKTNTTVPAGTGQVELSATAGGGPAFVQAANNGDLAAATTIAVTLPAAAKGGSLLVAAMTWDSSASTVVTCSDNQGNTYANATNVNDVSNTQAFAICYASNVAGGSTTLTATFGGSVGYRRMVVSEYTGIAPTSPVDITRTNLSNGTTTPDGVTSTAGPTTVAGDLIFGAAVDIVEPTGTIAAGSGFTQRNTTAGSVVIAVQDRIQAAAGSIASTQTFSLANRYHAHMVAFKAAPAPVAWAPPNIVSSVDTAGTEDAADVFVSGNYAYVADATILRIINITNPAAPSLTGSFTASGNINGIYVSGNFAYLATASNTAELTVVNVTTPASPTQTSVLNLVGTTDATGVFVSGTAAHMSRVNSTTAGDNEYYNINVTTPASPTVTGSLNLTATSNSVYVNGNFAYLATAVTSAELTIVNNTTPASPTQAGVYDASGTSAGNDVYGVGTTIYLGKANNTSGAEFFILNAANPASVSLVGSYENGANVNGVYVSGTYAFLGSAQLSGQFRVLNITTPATPTLVGGLIVTTALNDVFFAGGYAYGATNNDTKELAIFQPSPAVSGGGGGYQTTGTLESSTFDATASAGYNYITFTSSEPASTDVRFQLASNDNNSTWNYVGPDGTAGTYYSAAGGIRITTTGRYLRYRATLTGPGTSTPVLNDVTINYSP